MFEIVQKYKFIWSSYRFCSQFEKTQMKVISALSMEHFIQLKLSL